jgi:hypothetical protein
MCREAIARLLLLLLLIHIASSCKLWQGVYTLKDGFAFSFLSLGQVWPRFRSLGLISPLIARLLDGNSLWLPEITYKYKPKAVHGAWQEQSDSPASDRQE